MRLTSVKNLATFCAFFAMVAVLVGWIASLGVRVSPPPNRTALAIDVADINSMTVDGNVLLRGVPVGKVTSIDTSVANATIHFFVDGHYKIPVDSDVRLENLSALGESYIELEPRSVGGPVFQNGQRIPRAKQPASISELGTSVTRVLNQLDPQQLSGVIGEADAGLPDPDRVLPNLTRASLLLRNTTSDFKGTGRELLDNFQVLLRNAGFVGPALATMEPTVRDLGPILHSGWNHILTDALLYGGAPQLFQLSKFVQRIQKFLDDRGADLRVLGGATSENLKLIANGLKNIDSSQILSNLLATVPEDGIIDLHVPIPQR